ncbi:MAG: FimB/Mfa2 family fimbrial subunit [Bacteroidaceae bacterium]|nr:FimB/Mfa2 family fimbrial subunit [Bacteroidaceae bacterium]
MKRWCYLFMLCVLTSCLSPITMDDEEGGVGVLRSVNVLTRSGSPIQYPLTLYIFSADRGTLMASLTQHSEADELALQLSPGGYRMVALAGADECDVPSFPRLSDIITAPSDGHFTSSLQMGSVSVNITQNTTMSIALHNQLAAISISFCDIPAEATSVAVHLSLIASGLSFRGEYASPTTIRVPLDKQGDRWSTPLFYTLPSNGPLHLTVSTTTPTKGYSYGYTLPHSLQPNTPYVISGGLRQGVMANGSMPHDGWNEVEQISFNFGDDIDTVIVDDDIFEVDALPEVGTLWNGYFVVAHADSDDETDRMLLLSTTEWRGITSATHEATPCMATDIVSTYAEGALCGWRIPTRSEVRRMCAASGGATLDATNEYLATHGIAPLSTGDDADTGDAVRYLCDDASYSFRWDSDGKSSPVGHKRTYHLRLVRTVGFSVK